MRFVVHTLKKKNAISSSSTIIPLPFTPHPHTHHTHQIFNHFTSTISTLPLLRRHRLPPPPLATVVSAGSLWKKGPIEGVLFDIDGTLCDSDPLHFYAFRQMLQQDSVSGVKAGVGAGMKVVGVGRRNPQQLLTETGASFVSRDFNDPNLWTQLLF